ncbi:Helicase associated domain protein [Luminiphilus sp.]|nr:Helicase associated domain protein [Luminiphilus sp.]
MGNFRAFKNSFPEDSHSKGKAFERFLADWFFKNHPLYRHKFEKVWLWEDWPKPKGVAAQDLGTDLIARDTEGKIYAIQAKFYDVDSHITFKDISTFLADSSKDYIDHRLLIGTAELAPNARKQINSQEKPVSTFLLHDFEAWDFAWPKSLASLSKAKIKKPHEARPHQRAAIKDVCAKLDGRGQLIMACGTGKTLTGQRIAEKLESETTLVLLPSLLLLSGTMNEWLQQTKVGFHYLPVCSDASIGGKAAPETNFTSGELGNASTTDPDEIRAFLKQKGNKVIFSTYQSSGRVAEAIQDTKTCFDLILADEAHRCAGKVAADYGYVLDEKKLPAKNRLFMTATPRIYKPNIKKAAKDADIQIASMDDETVFGPVVHHLTFGKAIEDKLLTDYQVVVVGVNDTAVGEMVDERALVRTEAGLERDAQTLGSQLGLMKAVKKYDLQRVITFHSRINQARDYAAEFLEVMDATKKKDKPSGTITYSHVSGAMPTSERNNKLKALGLLEHEDRYLLGNARCLSEGVDVPALDGVAFVDPRGSEIDIIQAVGRAIRKSSDKTKGTIIIPVFIEEGDDPDLVLSTSTFDQVWKVVNALRAHDEKLGEELDGLRRAKGRNERAVFKTNKIKFDVHKTVSDDFLEAFRTKVVETTTSPWAAWFGALELFKEEHGHCHVPAHFTSKSGLKIGQWVGAQRKKKSRLTAQQIELLDDLGFSWDLLKTRWLEGFEALKQYHHQHGDCLVHAKHITEAGFKLGDWVAGQRKRFKNESMPKNEIAALNDLGFAWEALDQQWELGFQALLRYFREHGDCLVAAREVTEDEFPLGSWVHRQRSKRSRLSPERISQLNKINFVWDVQAHYWEQGLSLLIAYRRNHGDCLVPYDYVSDDGYLLGSWVTNQRSFKNKLSAENIDALNDLGFIWSVPDHLWEIGFKALERFHRENGHCVVPKGHVDEAGFSLGNWVGTNRKNRDSLSAAKLQRLESLGFVWDVYEQRWQQGLASLVEFVEENQHCLVPQAYKDVSGFSLGSWVSNLRTRHQELSAAERRALDQLGFVWDVTEYHWQQGFSALKKYLSEHGNIQVPRDFVDQDGLRLGNWIKTQRAAKETMPRQRRRMLDSIGFEWVAEQNRWRPFTEARKFARTLGLKTGAEWVSYVGSGSKPHDIPASPRDAYRGKGWVNIADWLGAGHLNSKNRHFKSFEEARKYAHSLKLKSQTEWQSFCRRGKRPADIPSNPQSKYRDCGWKGWGDWLGTGKPKKGEWRPFKDARRFVRTLGLTGQREWREYCASGKKPPDIPSTPRSVYLADGWVSLSDWLGHDLNVY